MVNLLKKAPGLGLQLQKATDVIMVRIKQK